MVLELQTRNKLNCLVPETEQDKDVKKFEISDKNQIKAFYINNGFVVIKKVFKQRVCDIFQDAWKSEIKNFKGKIYRQTNAKLETNQINQKGWVMNPILNLQSLDNSKFPRLRSLFDMEIVNHNKLAQILTFILEEKPKIVQSMYFEGNSATWEHQDSYYLDDEETGKMIAGWIALEDISADAGRFFVCPKSHLYDFSKMNLENVISESHASYINSIVEVIKKNNFKVEAPKLDKGDLLLWNSLTIHGALDSQSQINSRSSITLHMIRRNSKFKVLRNILRDLKTDQSGDLDIFRPKDMNKKRNKVIFFMESNFPFVFYKLKNISIKIITSIKS